MMKRTLTTAGALLGTGSLWLGHAAPAPKHGTTDYPTFDDAKNGWGGANNDPIAVTGGTGGSIKFSNTNNTLGQPAGEAGGNVSRTDGTAAYYADTSIGGPTNQTLGVGDRMLASGELYLSLTPGSDVNIMVGY